MNLQIDMFSEEPSKAPAKTVSGPRSSRSAAGAMDEADMVAYLAATGRYRILTKLEPRPVAEVVRPEFPLRGVILDTETTGLSHRKDEIIEIGAIAFSFDDDGTIGDVIGIYAGLQEPQRAHPCRNHQVDRDHR